MMRIASFVRGLLAAALIGVVTTLSSNFISRRLESSGAYGDPERALLWALGWLSLIARQPWFYPVAFIVGGLAAGAWLEWLLRHFDGSRERARKDLGKEMLALAQVVEHKQAGNYRPAFMSYFITAKKMGLWSPTPDQFLSGQGGPEFLLGYLRGVGTLLADGHFREAKRMAADAKRAIGHELTSK